MKRYYSALLALLTSLCAWSQNFSGLQNKSLNKLDDLSSLVESGIGSLFGGKIKGNIDSIKVLYDAEQELQVKIFFSGYENGIFKLQVLNAQKKNQSEVKSVPFSLAGKQSPVQCTLNLSTDFPKGQLLESPFFKIEITKDAGKPGLVEAYALNKKWKNELDPENVIVKITPQPIGSAAQLRNNEVKDVTPMKKVLFDQGKLYYTPRLDNKVSQPANFRTNSTIRAMDVTGHQAMKMQFVPSFFNYDNFLRAGIVTSDNISGTWTNTDGNTNDITKLIVTNNKEVQVFGKCSPSDCDWGRTPLTDAGNNRFEAFYKMGFKTSSITITYANSQLSLSGQDVYNDGRPIRKYVHSFTKGMTLVTSVTMARMYTVKDFATIAGSGAATTDYSAKGADSKSIYLWSDLKSDIDIEKPQDISNINMNIFPDKNPNSGVYYFIPADYHLKWIPRINPESGYTMNILYGGQSASGDKGAPVRMSASLTAGISSREINFIRTLLKASIAGVKEVRLLPLRENPVFSFQSYLTSQYNIPRDKIVVESSTDLANDIRVAWQTDADTKEFIQSALISGEGIAASVILKPQADGIIDQQIPVTINVSDVRTFGKIILDPATWRTKNWRNGTPYPLQLKHLNILKISATEHIPIIYSWSLNNEVVPSKAQVAFDAAQVPAWLDNQESALMWIDYSVMECKACDSKVMDSITGGVSGNRSQMVKFMIPPAVFDTLHASYFMVNIRSKQVDPNGESVKELATALRITRDADREFAAGPLFIPTNGSLEFEYRITLATTDGEFIKAGEWTRCTDKEVLLGKSRMKEIFPNNH